VAISFLSLQGSRYSNEKRKDKRDEVNGAGNWKDVSKKQRGRRTKTKITHLFMPDNHLASPSNNPPLVGYS